MSTELFLPPSVERRNKLDISLGYCSEIDPARLLSLGPAREIRVDDLAQLVDFLLHDSREDEVYWARHLPWDAQEWEHVCFARHGRFVIFASVYSTSLAYNPLFADGKRRRLCCGGTRIIGRRSLGMAAHRDLADRAEELVTALEMNLFLSQAMTGKNLSNGFNIGGSKALVYTGERKGRHHVEPSEVRDLARFMATFHNSVTATLPVFIGTGSDLNFHEHGEAYYDLCSRISPNYTGSALSARRWGRTTSGNTTAPTAAGVLACIDAVASYLGVTGGERSLLVKGLGGIGAAVARRYASLGWKIHATEIAGPRVDALRAELGDALELVEEGDWGRLPGVTLFSPNAAGASVTAENLPVLRKLGVRAIVGGENNILSKDVQPDVVYRDYGILTFADFLVNGGGAWIVDAEMVERPVDAVHDWIAKYQVPTVIRTIEAARATGRSPESLFKEFIGGKVRELLA